MMDDLHTPRARADIVAALTAFAAAEPTRSEYLSGLAAQIANSKPCLIPSWVVLDIVASLFGRAE